MKVSSNELRKIIEEAIREYKFENKNKREDIVQVEVPKSSDNAPFYEQEINEDVHSAISAQGAYAIEKYMRTAIKEIEQKAATNKEYELVKIVLERVEIQIKHILYMNKYKPGDTSK